MTIKQIIHDTLPATRLFLSKTLVYLRIIREGMLDNVLAFCKDKPPPFSNM